MPSDSISQSLPLTGIDSLRPLLRELATWPSPAITAPRMPRLSYSRLAAMPWTPGSRRALRWASCTAIW